MKAVMNVALISAVSVLTVIGVFSFSIAYQSHAVIKGVQERNIVESVNQMKFIEMGMEQAAVYSAYQGAYSVSKYGTYKDSLSDACKNSIPSNFPNDFPHWKVFANICFNPVENAINAQVNSEASDIFNKEYLEAIKKEYDITIPVYTSDIKSKDSEKFSVEFSSSDQIKFDSEKLKLWNKVEKIAKDISLPLKRLVDTTKEKFIDKTPEPFVEKIKEADTSMSSVTVSNIASAPGIISALLLNNNLNDGELTERGTRSCKSIKHEICVNPEDTLDFPLEYKDFEYKHPSKKDLLPTVCEDDFKKKVTEKIESLSVTESNTEISVKVKKLETKIDSDVENCAEPNQKDSQACDCAKWVCKGGKPVKVGIQDPTISKDVETLVSQTEKCTDCIKIDGNTCATYSSKICPYWKGYNHRDCDGDNVLGNGECVQLKEKECPSTHPKVSGSLCYKEVSCIVDPIDRCSGDHPTYDNGQCHRTTICEANKKCDPQKGCVDAPGSIGGTCNYDPKAPPPCPPDHPTASGSSCFKQGTCLEDPKPKQCPSDTDRKIHDGTEECWTCQNKVNVECEPGTEEFGSTGRCYKKVSAPDCATLDEDSCKSNQDCELVTGAQGRVCRPDFGRACALHRTLYTKTCDYKYQATVTSLVNAKDIEKDQSGKIKNKYPVYDEKDRKTDFRNLELHFYILSKN